MYKKRALIEDGMRSYLIKKYILRENGKKMNKKFQKRFLVVSVLLLLFLTAVTNIGLMYVGQKMRDDCQDMLTDVAKNADDHVYFVVRSYFSALSNISKVFAGQNDLKNDYVLTHVYRSKVGPFNSPIRLYLSDGTLITPDGLKKNFMTKDDFAKIASPKPYLSSVHLENDQSEKNVIDVFVPFRYRGKIEGMVASTIEVDMLSRFVKSSSFRGSASALILDRNDGSILLNHDKSVIKLSSFADRKFKPGYSYEAWKKGMYSRQVTSTVYQDEKTGKYIYVMAVPSNVVHWTFLTLVEDDVAFERSFLARKVFVILTIVEVLMFFLYIVWSLRSLRRRMEKESTEYYEIADALSDSFDVVFYVNLDKFSYEEFSLQKNTKQFNVVKKGKDFFDEIALRFPASDDGVSMGFAGAVQKNNFLLMLEQANPASFEFSSKYDDEVQYYRLKAVKSVKVKNHVIVAIENINEEVKNSNRQRNLIERSNSMIESLAADFECVNYVDMSIDKLNDVAENYRMSVLLARVIPGWTVEFLFYKKIQLLSKYFVCESDRVSFLQKTQREVILKNLQRNPIYFVNFLASVDGENYCYQLKFIANSLSSGELRGFIMGIHSIDEEVKQQMLVQKKLEKTLEIIDVLSENYTSLYYINLQEKDISVLSVLNKNESENDEIQPLKTPFVETVSHFIETQVYAEDRHFFFEILDVNELRKKLQHQKKINIVFRRNYGGIYKYSQMTIAKAENIDEEAVNVAVGFVEIDAQYRLEAMQRENIERIMNLSDEFECIYDVYLDTSKYRISAKDGKLTQQIVKNLEDYDDYFAYNAANIPKSVCKEDQGKLLECMTKEYMLERLEKEPSYFFDYRVMLDGKQVWYKVKITRTQSWQKDHRVLVGIFNNDEIYRREKAQREALENALEMARSASRAKTMFLNNMSHDIRTPMNAIIGYASLAQKHIDDIDKVLDYLNKITISSNHLFALINDVLDMSRIESGKITLDEKEDRISRFVVFLRDIVHADIIAKKLSFKIEVNDFNDETVFVDRLRINQVLLNVISNAIKYTPAGGEIVLSVSRKSCDKEGFTSYEFRVQDNGIGMTEEFLKKIYEPFTREKSSTVSGIQGTGLGMSIAKNIVDLMHGDIQVQSQVNVGTTVSIRFNLKVALHEPEMNTSILAQKRALVVSPDKMLAKNVVDELLSFSMDAQYVQTGCEACTLVESSSLAKSAFDVFVVDDALSDMSAMEVTKRLQFADSENKTVVLLMSSNWLDIGNAESSRGVSDIVPRPLFRHDLQESLVKCLEKMGNGKDLQEKTSFCGKKVVLVEDNELNREIAKEVLEDFGVSVTVVNDGSYVVDLMKKAKPHEFDLIFMDIQMPIMDGLEATRIIRAMENPEVSKIPIVAMTANAFAEDSREAFEVGVNDHIAKPVDVNKLEQILKKYLVS